MADVLYDSRALVLAYKNNDTTNHHTLYDDLMCDGLTLWYISLRLRAVLTDLDEEKAYRCNRQM